MEFLLIALILLAVVLFVTVPLRRSAGGTGEEEASGEEGEENPRIAELEARKEAKYREIRDTEMDHAAGKLSDDDFRRQDAELRREAIEILTELDRLRGESR